jgi:hypothetical protein
VLALPEGAPAGLCIQAREDHPPGMQTFDPILDKLVSMSAHNPEQIRELVRRPGLTEAVLDLVKGHGGEVVDGLVRVDRAEAMLSPTASLESIEILVGLLDKA